MHSTLSYMIYTRAHTFRHTHWHHTHTHTHTHARARYCANAQLLWSTREKKRLSWTLVQVVYQLNSLTWLTFNGRKSLSGFNCRLFSVVFIDAVTVDLLTDRGVGGAGSFKGTKLRGRGLKQRQSGSIVQFCPRELVHPDDGGFPYEQMIRATRGQRGNNVTECKNGGQWHKK